MSPTTFAKWRAATADFCAAWSWCMLAAFFSTPPRCPITPSANKGISVKAFFAYTTTILLLLSACGSAPPMREGTLRNTVCYNTDFLKTPFEKAADSAFTKAIQWWGAAPNKGGSNCEWNIYVATAMRNVGVAADKSSTIGAYNYFIYESSTKAVLHNGTEMFSENFSSEGFHSPEDAIEDLSWKVIYRLQKSHRSKDYLSK